MPEWPSKHFNVRMFLYSTGPENEGRLAFVQNNKSTLPTRSNITVSMNRLDASRRAQVVRCLCEGNSIRSTVRMAGAAKDAVVKLLIEIGAAYTEYMDRTDAESLVQATAMWTRFGASSMRSERTLPAQSQRSE